MNGLVEDAVASAQGWPQHELAAWSKLVYKSYCSTSAIVLGSNTNLAGRSSRCCLPAGHCTMSACASSDQPQAALQSTKRPSRPLHAQKCYKERALSNVDHTETFWDTYSIAAEAVSHTHVH